MEEPILKDTNQKEVTCKNCAAKLTFKPGTSSLVCEYCGAENEIEVQETVAEELDFDKFISEEYNNIQKEEVTTVACESCGAKTTFNPHVVSDFCPFCGSVLVSKKPETSNFFRPSLLIPFTLDHKKAFENFQLWIKKLWWAPSNLKKYAVQEEKLKGLYIPYWTYDSQTYSRYTGQRGDDYYVTETRTVNGKTESHQVKKTRWTSVSGNISHFFDDVLVCASKSLPVKYIDKLEPWDYTKMLNYDEKFVSGFTTETYQVDVKEGFGNAKVKMEDVVRSLVRQDIGGDHQRISTLSINYDKITFKHLLLPIWVSAYRYKKKIYRFLVNGQTGKVQGERPWSWIKITLAILVGLAIIAGAIYLIDAYSQNA
ncbi:MAG: hypothetical protein CVU05_10455 [Bacteroidetes bacterium HGW-Bacteroidetes-21]|jgi:predicted RNA-binding Zn-ribbon protein involved in translation (DUF1610 family)|nr:MAG: hypothetical protein CVU05_10455 [Bacteroidetes bacterium HGW-Bacteroidetes-21]